MYGGIHQIEADDVGNLSKTIGRATMHEICVPIPHFGEHQVAEVVVTVNGKKEQFDFRVESFPWGVENIASEAGEDLTSKIQQLRDNIEGYDSGWEIVQIYNPNEKANFIQVLFRKKK